MRETGRIFMGHEDGPPEEISPMPLEERNKLSDGDLRELIIKEVLLGIYKQTDRRGKMDARLMQLTQSIRPSTIDSFLDAELERRKRSNTN